MTQLKQTWDRFDKGYLVVVAICLIAIWPFISRPALPQETDAELHIFRLAELSHLVRAGELYPRWAPNFYYGYGYPIFNYYAPLTYYLALPFALAPGLGPVAGVKAIFVLGLLSAGIGMYGFVRDNWGQPAGYVAAALYVYAPYIQYVDPHARGDLAEAFSFGLFPLALWALDRLRRQVAPWNWLAAVLLTTAVILSHNLMALVFFGLLLAWTVFHASRITHHASRITHHASRITQDASDISSTSLKPSPPLPRSPASLLPLLLAIGVAAFFWLPVALEQDAVNLDSLIGDGSHFDFRNHFLSWQTLLAPSPWLDWGASEPAFGFNLGIAQWFLGGFGLVLLLAVLFGLPVRLAVAGHLAFFALTLAGLIFLMLPASIFAWELIPLLPFMQFPWRLLGAAAAMLAILGGAGVSALASYLRPSLGRWLPGLTVGATLLLALPLSQVPSWPADFGDTGPFRVLHIELAGHWLGTTATADFVPATVDVLPHPEGAVLEDFYHGRPPERVNRATLPEGTTVTIETISPLHTRYHVSGQTDFLLRLFLFDFPGWVARVNGQIVETELGRPEGFLVIPVPAGEHVVDLRFGSTLARTLATLISVFSLGLTLLLALLISSGRWQMNGASSLSDASREKATGRDARLVAQPLRTNYHYPTLLIAFAILIIHLLLLEPMGWLRYHSTGYTVEPAENHVFADFGEQIALIGYNGAIGSVRPGNTLSLTLYWKAQTTLDINYQVFVHVLAPDGTLVAQSDKLNPGEFPTRRWPPDKYVRDEHRVTLPPDLPPGNYRLSTGLWVAGEGWRLPLLNETGQQIGDNYVLLELLVNDN